MESSMCVSVTNIQKFSLDDGPGIRTTVFLKGCSLSCKWCHNPETISAENEFKYDMTLCMGCGQCMLLCKNGVHKVSEGSHTVDRTRCAGCMTCTEACPSGALGSWATSMGVDKVFEQVKKDLPFYTKSGGGVTVSGGEPLLHTEFVKSLLGKCREQNIHTAVDTAGNVPFEMFDRVRDVTDLFLFDVKFCSPQKHRDATGADNGRIWQNLSTLHDEGENVWIRIPVIPGFHDEKEMRGIAERLCRIGHFERIDILPYHRYGVAKYVQLGRDYEIEDSKTQVLPEELSRYGELLSACGNVVIGV